MTHTPSEKAREALAIGTPVRCVVENIEAKYAADWMHWSGFIARLEYCPGNGLNYAVSDEWPPKHITDGFAPNQLAALQSSPPPVAGEEETARGLLATERKKMKVARSVAMAYDEDEEAVIRAIIAALRLRDGEGERAMRLVRRMAAMPEPLSMTGSSESFAEARRIVAVQPQGDR